MSRSHISKVMPTPAAALAKKARALAAQGMDIVNMASGDVDFPTPDVAKEAAIRAAHSGSVSYTNVDGEPTLKSAIAHDFQVKQGVHIKDDQVIVSTGSKQSIFNALFVSTEPGDEIIVPAPYWSSYLDIALLCECRPVVVPCERESAYKLTAEALEAAITSKTKWLVLTSPSSPVGSVYSEAELSSLCDVLNKYPRVQVLCDDLYEAFVFDGAAHLNISAVRPELADRILTINGVSKSYAMMGWRIGWAIGSRKIISDMSTLQSQVTSSASTIGQAAAKAALTLATDHRENIVRQVGVNRSLAIDVLGRVNGLTIAQGAGSIYLYLNVSKFCVDDRKLSEQLLNETGLVVLPGTDCGMSPFMRINIARKPSDLNNGLERLKRFFGHF